MGGIRYATPEAASEARRRINRETQKRCRERKATKVRYSGDLTRKEIIEILNLVFPFDRPRDEDIDINYFDGDFGGFVDLREAVTLINFNAVVRYHIPELPLDNVTIRILPTLDVYGYYTYEGQTESPRLLSRNQYRIQQKFVEWKICPQFVFD